MNIKIVAKKEGFRRAGIAHYGTVIYPGDRFTPKQLKLLETEKNLDVFEVDEEPTPRIVKSQTINNQAKSKSPAKPKGKKAESIVD